MRHKTLITCLSALSFALPLQAFANEGPINLTGASTWQRLSAEASASPSVTVLAQGADFIDVRVELAGYNRSNGLAAADGYTALEIPGEGKLATVGAAALPIVSRLVALPSGAKASVEVLHAQRSTVSTGKVMPAQPLVQRCAPLAPIPFAEDQAFYGKDAWYPSTSVEVTSHGQVGEQGYARVQIQPMRYNPVKASLEITTSMDLRIRFNGARAPMQRARNAGQDRVFSQRLLGYDSLAPSTRADTVPETMLVIVADELEASLAPYVDWKTRRGINVIVRKTSEVGFAANNEDAVQKAVKEAYEDTKNNLRYVVLVGNEDTIGSFQMSDQGDTDGQGESDSTYVFLAGDDLIPDVHLGRLSAASSEDLDTMITRVLSYERDYGNSEEVADWPLKAIGVASNQSGSGPSDTERMKDILSLFEDNGFVGTDTFYEDDNPNSNSLTQWIDEGRGWIPYMGHGSGTSWAFQSIGSFYGLKDVQGLNNQKGWPIVLDCACSNGDFYNLEPSFTEAWLRANNGGSPTGALLMLSSTVLADWDPPAIMETGVVEAAIAQDIYVWGDAYLSGIMKMEAEVGNSSARAEKFFISFGDPSLLMRNGVSETVKIADSKITADSAELTVATEAGKAPQDATVALNKDGKLLAVGKTDTSGKAVLTLLDGATIDGTVQAVVTGLNLVALMTDVEVGGDDDDDDTGTGSEETESGETDTTQDDDDDDASDDDDDDDSGDDDDDADDDDDDASGDDSTADDDDDASGDDDDDADDDDDDDETTEDDDEGADDSGKSGCQVATSTPATTIGALALLALALRRRRRQ